MEAHKSVSGKEPPRGNIRKAGGEFVPAEWGSKSDDCGFHSHKDRANHRKSGTALLFSKIPQIIEGAADHVKVYRAGRQSRCLV
jgi:hypothetical protein